MSHPRAPAHGPVRLFVPIDPKDPWYKNFEDAWRKHAAADTGSTFTMWEDAPAIRELEIDLAQARKHVEAAIRELVNLRLESMHVEKTIAFELDKKVAAAVAAAVDRAGASAAATAKAMLEKAVSAEVASKYEIVTEVSIRRKSNGPA